MSEHKKIIIVIIYYKFQLIRLFNLCCAFSSSFDTDNFEHFFKNLKQFILMHFNINIQKRMSKRKILLFQFRHFTHKIYKIKIKM